MNPSLKKKAGDFFIADGPSQEKIHRLSFSLLWQLFEATVADKNPEKNGIPFPAISLFTGFRPDPYPLRTIFHSYSVSAWTYIRSLKTIVH
ncbi:MAG: hypothetical protein ACOYJI_07790 [Anaerovoracaceae bacterium]|jgi:hypothetical protein